MPRKGYKTITVDQDTFTCLGDLAEKLDKTIPETVRHLMSESSNMNRTAKNEVLEFPERCDPLETCETCILKNFCWLKKLLLGDEKTMRIFVKAVKRELSSEMYSIHALA